MRQDKRNRMLAVMTCHKGSVTVDHVLSTVLNDPEIAALPGHILGKIANIRHAAYQEGKHAQEIDTWAYDGPQDFLAGLGHGVRQPSGNMLSQGFIEVDESTVTLTLTPDEDTKQAIIYKRT